MNVTFWDDTDHTSTHCCRQTPSETSRFEVELQGGLPAFGLAVDLIRNGEIDIEPFEKHQFPIIRVREAFALTDPRDDGAPKVSLTS